MINNKYVIGIVPRYNEVNNQKFVRIATNYYRKFLDGKYTLIFLLSQPNIMDLVKMCDGFIVTGGDDIDPKYYGENNDLGLSKDIDPVIDELDQQVVTYAYKNKLPMLGICRGIQAFAAFLGGSLHQDLESCQISHPLVSEHEHLVVKVNNFGIATKLPDSFMVNSFHHQAVAKPPKGFIALFQNGDCIEAIQHESLPIIGFQWHPERYFTNESDIIFDYYKELLNERNNH